MYGFNMPNGFIPVCATTGTPVTAMHINYNYQIRPGTGDGQTASLYRGDLVYLTPAAGNNQGYVTKLPVVANASQVPFLGVFQGVQFIAADGTPKDQSFWLTGTPVLANTIIRACVADAPNYLFLAQVSKAGAATLSAPTLVQADIGCTFNFGEGALTGAAPFWSGSATGQPIDPADQPNNPTGGDVYRGSAQYIDYVKRFDPAAANGDIANFRLEQIFPGPQNRPGLFFNCGLFKINNYQLANRAASA